MATLLQTFTFSLIFFAVGAFQGSVGYAVLYATPQSTAQWREYTSPEGKFSILLPGAPTTGYRPIGKGSSSSVTYVVNLQNPDSAYIIAYFDVPYRVANPKATEKLLDDTRDRVVDMYSLKLEDEQKISHQNYPARSLNMRDQGGKRFLTRIVLVKQRVYHVSLVPYNSGYNVRDIDKYFESFKPIPLTDSEIKSLASFSKEENEKAFPQKIRVSEGSLRSRALNMEFPKYPAKAKEQGVSGTVKVQLLISEQGQVVEATATDGPEQLREAAVLAARKWTFKPVVMGRYPLRVEGELSFEFRPK